MENIKINRQQLLELLCSKTRYKGDDGILILNGNKLYKIYYWNLYKSYSINGEEYLDSEIKLLKRKQAKFKYLKTRMKEFERLKETKSNNLITGILTYKGLIIGIEMNYLKDYITLQKASLIFKKEKIDKYYDKCRELVDDLLEHDIFPYDIHSGNILVNVHNDEVALIDLDGEQTLYMPYGYAKRYSYKCEDVRDRIDAMREEIDEAREFRIHFKLGIYKD